MGKKIVNIVLFLAVVAAAVGMTIYTGKGAASVMVYNFVFFGVMVLIYLSGMIGGMFKMNHLSEALRHGTEEVSSIFKAPGKAKAEDLSVLNEIFGEAYLDKKIDTFRGSIDKSQEGIGDVEDFINEEEIDLHIHKRLLEMVPDILTSLGILGTFVGLVWGLKNFNPNDYAAMTSSVASLVDGIKVAFLTSIYGIALSIVYTYGMKSEYSSLTENLQGFLDRFHAYVMPTAENESRNLLVSSQKIQTEAMNKMAEQFSVQMADSFEKVITPTFRKMNDSLDMLVTSVTRCQQDAVKEILDGFMKEMHGSFQLQFRDFNEALNQLPPEIPVQWNNGIVSSLVDKKFIFVYPAVCAAIRYLLRPLLYAKMQIRGFYGGIITEYLTNYMCFVALSTEVFSVLFLYGIVENIVNLLAVDTIVLIGMLLVGLVKMNLGAKE